MDERSTQSDLNVFQEEKDSKTVDKKSINVNNAENVASSSDDTIVDESSSDDTIVEETDEDIAFLQEKAVRAAAKSIENMTNTTRNVKPNNPKIEAALSSTKEATSSRKVNRTSRTQSQLVAYHAEKMSKEARRVSAEGRTLLETITSTIEVLQSHVGAFEMKASEATEVNTRGYNLADFYRNMVDKYERSIGILQRKFMKLDIALDRVDDTAHECFRYVMLAEEIREETLEESKRIKYRANRWIEKGKSAIIVALKKERAALVEMRLIWLNVRNDTVHEERAKRTSEEDSDYNTTECANKDRMTKVGHVASTVLGISLLSVTSLFEVGSDSYNAILALGLLTTGWSAVYWSHKFYMCLKSEDDDEEEIMIERTNLRDSYLENCDRNMTRVQRDLLKYGATCQSGESDTDSIETIRIEDFEEIDQ